MTPRTHTPVVLACLALAVALLAQVIAIPRADAQPAPAAWAHAALPHDGADLGADLGRQINRMGDDGWQLVDVAVIVENGTTTKTVYYFRKPK